MKGKYFLIFWFCALLFLSLEFYRLNNTPAKSTISFLQKKGVVNSEFNTSPEPGRPLSLYLGYAGFGLMLLSNLYIFRKRFSFMHKWGKLHNWLNFHIFCGLMGPTCILFHCNFKVHGLVAISFWSMTVSVSSGIVGRYLYTQISKMKSDFMKEAEFFNTRLKSLIEKSKIQLSEIELSFYRDGALALAGASAIPQNPFAAFFVSLKGDVTLMFKSPVGPPQLGDVGSLVLKKYAVNVRKANTVASFNKLMGYWHTFHTPFAVFMYVAAIFHIIAAVMLGV